MSQKLAVHHRWIWFVILAMVVNIMATACSGTTPPEVVLRNDDPSANGQVVSPPSEIWSKDQIENAAKCGGQKPEKVYTLKTGDKLVLCKDVPNLSMLTFFPLTVGTTLTAEEGASKIVGLFETIAQAGAKAIPMVVAMGTVLSLSGDTASPFIPYEFALEYVAGNTVFTSGVAGTNIQIALTLTGTLAAAEDLAVVSATENVQLDFKSATTEAAIMGLVYADGKITGLIVNTWMVTAGTISFAYGSALPQVIPSPDGRHSDWRHDPRFTESWAAKQFALVLATWQTLFGNPRGPQRCGVWENSAGDVMRFVYWIMTSNDRRGLLGNVFWFDSRDNTMGGGYWGKDVKNLSSLDSHADWVFKNRGCDRMPGWDQFKLPTPLGPTPEGA